MSVLILKLKGGLNQITFLFRFRLIFWDGFSNLIVAWDPLFLSAVSYIILALLNLVPSHDMLEMRLLVIDGNCLMIDRGWLDFESIYRRVLFGFFKKKYFSVFKLKETSKISVSMRFVSNMIDSPLSQSSQHFLRCTSPEPRLKMAMDTSYIIFFRFSRLF